MNIEDNDEECFNKIEAPLSRSLQPVSDPLGWTFDQQVMLCNLSFQVVFAQKQLQHPVDVQHAANEFN